MGAGSLASRVGDNNGNTAQANITSGTTTSFVKGSATANKHVGSIAYVKDNDDSAGAAPEGECSIVVANTASIWSLDANMPYSTALAANDDIDILGTWNIEASAADDIAWVVFGIVVGKDGITAANAGWCQSWGMCPNAVADTAAVTINKPMVAGAGTIITGDGTDPANVIVGYAPIGAQSDLASPFKTLVFLTLDFGFMPGDVDLNAS